VSFNAENTSSYQFDAGHGDFSTSVVIPALYRAGRRVQEPPLVLGHTCRTSKIKVADNRAGDAPKVVVRRRFASQSETINKTIRVSKTPAILMILLPKPI